MSPTKSRYSNPVKNSYRRGDSGTYPTCLLTATGSSFAFIPRTFTEPESGVINARIIFREVDLPEPFGPKRPKISPYLTFKST